MGYISVELRKIVRKRAKGYCEYCLVNEMDAFFSFEPDHIISEKHGGKTTLNNLAFACFRCNRHKGSDIASNDPASGNLIGFFNPRTENWKKHFRLDGAIIVPLTPEGRVTVELLQLNHPFRLNERKMLMQINRYPP